MKQPTKIKSRKVPSALSPATNLLSAPGTMEDPPSTTYLLLAQHFEDGKELEWIQDVELSYDEYFKVRRYLAELRGLLPANKKSA